MINLILNLKVKTKFKPTFSAPLTTMTATKKMDIMFTNKMFFDGGNFKVCWTYDKQYDMMHFKLDINGTGWVSFGFTTTPRKMNNYDVAITWVGQDGKGYIEVCYLSFSSSSLKFLKRLWDTKLYLFVPCIVIDAFVDT